MRHHILRIDKPSGSLNPHTSIERVFASNPLAILIPNLPGYWLSVRQVLIKLALGDTFFCTDLQGNVAEVKRYFYSVQPRSNGLLTSARGYQLRICIRTKPDDTNRNNLLFLPNVADTRLKSHNHLMRTHFLR